MAKAFSRLARYSPERPALPPRQKQRQDAGLKARRYRAKKIPRRALCLLAARRDGNRREVLRLRFAPAETAGKGEARETPLRMTVRSDALVAAGDRPRVFERGGGSLGFSCKISEPIGTFSCFGIIAPCGTPEVTWGARRSFLRRGGLARRLRRGGRRRGGRLSIGRRSPANRGGRGGRRVRGRGSARGFFHTRRT